MNFWRPKWYRTLVFNIWAALLKTVVTLSAATLTCQHINAQKWATVMFFFKEAEQEKFGKIQYFIRIPGSPYFNAPVAKVRYFSLLQDLGLVKGYFYRVLLIDEENLVPVENLQKIFFFPTQLKSEEIVENGFIIKLCKTFEHS